MSSLSRRTFLKQNAILSVGAALTPGLPTVAPKPTPTTPAILGGTPLLKNEWPKWPRWNPETDEPRLLEVLRSGIWSRAGVTAEFEQRWAQTLGVKRSLLVVNGTNALTIALNQLDIRAGDEVLIPPYTFIATATAVLANGAMPVFVDVDPDTFQIDPAKIEAKITPRTKAIMPVHILGLPADMPAIMAIAQKYNLVVIEDACQAHLAEINHQKVGTIGQAGCFSFQNSKNLAIGEGGAIVSNDDALMDRCFSYQNFGYPHGNVVGSVATGSIRQGAKLRITEYQAAIGLAQLTRLDAETTTRNTNAAYLKSRLATIPGIVPYKLYDHVTRAAFHLFAFRYQQEAFGSLPRAAFLKALQAEGVPCSSGYATLPDQLFLKDAFTSKNFRKIYPREMLHFGDYVARNACPVNGRLCNEEAVWFTQNMLLGTRPDMDLIADAVARVHQHADTIRKQTNR